MSNRTAPKLEELISNHVVVGALIRHYGLAAYGSVHWDTLEMTHKLHIHNDGPGAGRRDFRHLIN